MAVSILRVKDGLDCSHLVGSLVPEELHKSDSQGSFGSYVNNGMELDATDPAAAGGKNGTSYPASPISLKENQINKNSQQDPQLFGRKRNKSADDILGGVYR